MQVLSFKPSVPCAATRWLCSGLLALCVAAVGGCGAFRNLPTDPETGILNFARVNDTLYRGGQPEAEQFDKLHQMGIRTVVCMRTFNTDRSRVDASQMDLVHISFKGSHVEEEDVIAFLKVATDPAAQPVFVHCKLGADRTGLLIAVYRMVVEGWSRQRAIDEMYAMGYYDGWSNMLRYVKRVDVAKLRREVGIAPTN